MRKDTLGMSLALLLAAPFKAMAGQEGLYFERCLEAALGERAGQVVKVEYKIEDGRGVYEFDIRGLDGRDWDIECERDSGRIIEIEQEVPSPNHPLFKAQARIGEQAARRIALEAFPGDIIEVEYEIESDGKASYEFDILMADGREMKIEVDAGSGDIVEISEEMWQVGLE